jgi:hypothetical protein
MAIDPSIALSANAGGGNLLQTLQGATQLRGLQQQQQANVAASQAYRDATNPQTGQIDYNRLTALLSQGDAAYNLPQYQQQINEARNSTLQFDKGQLELAQKKSDALANGFGGLLSTQDFTPAGVYKVAARAVSQGLITPEEVVKFTADMPTDAAQLPAWVQQRYLGFANNVEKLKALAPQIQTVNTGAQQVITPINPLTGQVSGGQTIFNNQLSPEAASQPTQIYDPATQSMRTITREQFSTMAQPGAAGGGLPAIGGGALGSGRINAAPAGPGLQAAPSLGTQAAAEVVGKGAAESSLALQSQADAAPQSIYQFQNMREKLADINTGPGTDWRTTTQAFITGLSPDIAAKIGIDPQKIASAEEFKKYATQATQATLAGLGEGTDSKLASAAAANPGTQLSKLGNQQLIDVLIAGQRAILAKNQAWQASGLPPEQYNKFSTQWSREIDPRVFVAQDMDPAARYKMLDSLPKKDQETFKRSYINARNLGYVQ